MSDWITDHRPTEDDADPNGKVIARHDGLSHHPHVNFRDVTVHCHWRHTPLWLPPLPTIKVGQTWRRSDGAEVKVFIDDGTDTAPLHIGETADCARWYRRNGTTAFNSDRSMRLVELIQDAPEEPALAVGQRWRRRDGEVVTVERYDNNHQYGATHPFWAGGSSYTVDGIFNGLERPGSDLDLVELIEPAAEPAEIPEPIRTGASPFFVLVVGDDSGGKVDGNPIVWETQIPEGANLQAVLQQRQRVGSHYGTTYVAECRIIPELTSEVTREVPF